MAKTRYIANACKSCYQDEQEVKRSDDIVEITNWIDNLRMIGECKAYTIWERKYDRDVNGMCYQVIAKTDSKSGELRCF